MKENIIQDNSFLFAERIIKLYRFLTEERREFILAKQILRSGTSIGANIEETIWSWTRKEFLQKVSISYREARETHYWLRLLKSWEYISEEQFCSIAWDCEEIIRILWSIQKTTKENTISIRNS